MEDWGKILQKPYMLGISSYLMVLFLHTQDPLGQESTDRKETEKRIVPLPMTLSDSLE